MKKIVLSALVMMIAIATLQAQQNRRPQRPENRQQRQSMMMKLNLTDDQKAQMKTYNEDFRKQMAELKKNEDITVKEWKSRMANLRKDHKAKMESVLTKEQKDQVAKMKADRQAMRQVDAKARAEKMKIKLGLSDDQTAKMEKLRTDMHNKMQGIRQNDSLAPEQKKEMAKDLMKKQKAEMKSILTDEQLKKLQDMKPHRGGGKWAK